MSLPTLPLSYLDPIHVLSQYTEKARSDAPTANCSNSNRLPFVSGEINPKAGCNFPIQLTRPPRLRRACYQSDRYHGPVYQCFWNSRDNYVLWWYCYPRADRHRSSGDADRGGFCEKRPCFMQRGLDWIGLGIWVKSTAWKGTCYVAHAWAGREIRTGHECPAACKSRE